MDQYKHRPWVEKLGSEINTDRIDHFFISLDEIAFHIDGMVVDINLIEQELFSAHFSGDVRAMNKIIKNAAGINQYRWTEFEEWFSFFKTRFAREPNRVKYLSEEIVRVIEYRAYMRYRLQQIRNPALMRVNRYVVVEPSFFDKSGYSANILESLGWQNVLHSDDNTLDVAKLPIHPDLSVRFVSKSARQLAAAGLSPP